MSRETGQPGTWIARLQADGAVHLRAYGAANGHPTPDVEGCSRCAETFGLAALLTALDAALTAAKAELQTQNAQLHREVDARIEAQVEAENVRGVLDPGWRDRAEKAEAALTAERARTQQLEAFAENYIVAAEAVRCSAMLLTNDEQAVAMETRMIEARNYLRKALASRTEGRAQ